MESKKSRTPYFTVCIPAYNRAYILDRCLESLINQTFKDFEVILVDDGSTDSTEDLVQAYQKQLDLHYIKKENGGKHTALNVGIQNASETELFLVLDSDDWLDKGALQILKDIWDSFTNEERNIFCGIMGKCRNEEGKNIGNLFPSNPYITSYLEFHFGGHNFGDCCECTKTSIIKKYSYPEPEGTKFVPEYYIYDQIGLIYKLYCINNVICYREYMKDGITQNIKEFFRKNSVGYTYGLVCRIEKIFPVQKRSIPLKERVIIWYDYWRACSYDTQKRGARVHKVDSIGLLGNILYWIKWLLVRLSIKESL